MKLFITEQIQWKLMIRFFFKPHPNFLDKKSFSKKIELSGTLEGLWHHAKIYINLMIQFQENIQTDVRSEWWTELISKDPSSYQQGSNKYSRLAFKSQRYRVQCWSNQNCCMTIIMQKISSNYKLIQQILGSHELNGHAHLWPLPPKNHWNNF